MNFGNHCWTTIDASVNLMNLFEYLRFTPFAQTETYCVYHKSNQYYIVIRTEQGYRYYHSEKPELKLCGSDLIGAFCAVNGSGTLSSIWERIDEQYDAYLAEGMDANSTVTLSIVPIDFNHFETLVKPLTLSSVTDFYQNALQIQALGDSVVMDEEGQVLFPLYNSANRICGFLKDTTTGVSCYPYAQQEQGIWYTQLPKKIVQLFIFSSPKEALAFYVHYQPVDTVCIACASINASTVATILQLKKVSKAKKVWVSFTGDSLMKGYTDDLAFMVQMQYPTMTAQHSDGYVKITFPVLDDTAFGKFYKKVQEFNIGVSNQYKKICNTKTVHQTSIMKYAIMVKRMTSGYILCQIPSEINATKFMIWAYHKFFMPQDLGILKPKKTNWYAEYTRGEKTTDYKMLKLAI